MKKSGAKVKWSSECMPKKEGGLGFRGLKDWNKRLQWLGFYGPLLKNANNSWIRWIHTGVIKEQCMWSISVPTSGSWTISKVFSLRKQVHP